MKRFIMRAAFVSVSALLTVFIIKTYYIPAPSGVETLRSWGVDLSDEAVVYDNGWGVTAYIGSAGFDECAARLTDAGWTLCWQSDNVVSGRGRSFMRGNDTVFMSGAGKYDDSKGARVHFHLTKGTKRRTGVGCMTAEEAAKDAGIDSSAAIEVGSDELFDRMGIQLFDISLRRVISQNGKSGVRYSLLEGGETAVTAFDVDRDGSYELLCAGTGFSTQASVLLDIRDDWTLQSWSAQLYLTRGSYIFAERFGELFLCALITSADGGHDVYQLGRVSCRDGRLIVGDLRSGARKW